MNWSPDFLWPLGIAAAVVQASGGEGKKLHDLLISASFTVRSKKPSRERSWLT